MPVSETPSRTEISSGRVPFRVLWQNEHYPDPVKGGGGAINTYYIVKELARLGCDPLIQARGDTNCDGREEDAGGTRVLRISPRRPPDAVWPIWPVLSAAYLRQTLTGITRQFAGFVCIDAPYALSLKRSYPHRPLVCRIEGTTRGYRAAISDDRVKPVRTLADRRVDFLSRLLVWENDLCDRLAWRRSDALVVKSRFVRDDVARLFGSGSILFARHGFDVTCADVSSPLLDFAKWRLDKRGLTASYVDLKEQGLTPGPFGAITAFDVLEHLLDPVAVIRKLRAHLAPGGLLCFNTPFDHDDARPMHVYHDEGLLRHVRAVGFVRRYGAEADIHVVEKVRNPAYRRWFYRLYDDRLQWLTRHLNTGWLHGWRVR